MIFTSRESEKGRKRFPSLDQLDGRRALKIVWYGDPVILQKIRQKVAGQYGGKVEVLSTESENLEFMPRGINKATALAKVAEEYGILPGQVLTFGDGENDVEMLAWAGMGVAMRHGNSAAIAAAKLVSPPGPPETAFARAVEVLFKAYGEAAPRTGEFSASGHGRPIPPHISKRRADFARQPNHDRPSQMPFHDRPKSGQSEDPP